MPFWRRISFAFASRPVRFLECPEPSLISENSCTSSITGQVLKISFKIFSQYQSPMGYSCYSGSHSPQQIPWKNFNIYNGFHKIGYGHLTSGIPNICKHSRCLSAYSILSPILPFSALCSTRKSFPVCQIGLSSAPRVLAKVLAPLQQDQRSAPEGF